MTKPANTTKPQLICKMMRRRSGASIKTLCAATGWQTHSVRAAISTLRKAGYAIERRQSDKSGGCSVYQIKQVPKDIAR